MSITWRPSCLTAAGGDLAAEHGLFAGIVHESGERKLGFWMGWRMVHPVKHGPPRSRLAGVPPLNPSVCNSISSRRSSHQPARLPRQLLRRGDGPGAKVQLENVGDMDCHCRGSRACRMTKPWQQQVLKFSQHVRAMASRS